MIINGKILAEQIIEQCRQEVTKLAKKPHLVDVLVEGKPQDYSFVKAKQRAIEKIGGTFQMIDYKKAPEFQQFVGVIKKVVEEEKTTAIVIQKPLPSSLNTDTLYNFIPLKKEIEGHKAKTLFYPPLGLASLTILKYIYMPGDKTDIKNVIVDIKKDMLFFKKILKRKKIVIVGRGETGGKPIGYLLNFIKINFININSKTPNVDYFYKDADIIITAVGKKVLTPELLKPGVILLNAGLRKENDKLVGDYDEEEIKDIAGFYTPTPGGVGPLDIAYLMNNIVQSVKLQQ
jgi:methylenetetrahydrofolate dehydrogenase (NADP+)/methenyltetrahydrofolate cyclohydrolase